MAPSLTKKQDGVPELFKLVQNATVNWTKVMQRASTQPQEAHYVHPDNKFTALHHAVFLAPGVEPSDARLNSVRALLLANPGAATASCAEHGYTPLAYACLNADNNDHQVIQLLLEMSPDSMGVLSKHGKSPLELHMKSVSKKMAIDPTATKASIETLQLLLSNGNYNVTKTLETLFCYNSLRILEKLALEEAIASLARLQARRQARASNKKGADASKEGVLSKSSSLDQFWVWQWALVLLEHEHQRRFSKDETIPPFYPLLVASSIKDCPLPFLMMATRAHPSEISQADTVTGNLPLHNVAFWDAQDPDKVSRKSMALTALGREYPTATKIKNKQGKTPLSLALETGTSWDKGVRCLTQKKEQVASPVPPKRDKRPLKKEKSARSVRT